MYCFSKIGVELGFDKELFPIDGKICLCGKNICLDGCDMCLVDYGDISFLDYQIYIDNCIDIKEQCKNDIKRYIKNLNQYNCMYFKTSRFFQDIGIYNNINGRFCIECYKFRKDNMYDKDDTCEKCRIKRMNKDEIKQCTDCHKIRELKHYYFNNKEFNTCDNCRISINENPLENIDKDKEQYCKGCTCTKNIKSFINEKGKILKTCDVCRKINNKKK